MIPLFVSDYSLGRSILKLKPTHEGGPSDILSMAKEAELKEVYLVEDTMIGFLEAHKAFSEAGIALRFGVRFNICNDVAENRESSAYKIILFALNDKGCKELYNIFSEAFSYPEREGYLDLSLLEKCPKDNLLLVHPFYDSFLANNVQFFKNCVFNSPFPTERELFSVENNGMPFDTLLKDAIDARKDILPSNKIETKTILYRLREDVEAYQVYRMACNRSFGKSRGLSAPNLQHFGSNEFCFQSYMEKEHGKFVKI